MFNAHSAIIEKKKLPNFSGIKYHNALSGGHEKFPFLHTMNYLILSRACIIFKCKTSAIEHNVLSCTTFNREKMNRANWWFGLLN